MKLTYSKSLLSIQNFPEIDIPSFAVITGVNGSGKTHLLRSIENGSIIAEGAQSKNHSIRYFDWGSIVPKDEVNF